MAKVSTIRMVFEPPEAATHVFPMARQTHADGPGIRKQRRQSGEARSPPRMTFMRCFLSSGQHGSP